MYTNTVQQNKKQSRSVNIKVNKIGKKLNNKNRIFYL